jgi:hypothetical protein
MSGSQFRSNPESSPQHKHRPDSETSDNGAALLRRASDAAAQAAVRLDRRTHLDSGRYRIVLRDYGGGLGEIGWSFIPNRVPSKAGRGESESVEENRDRAARRARSRLRQLILTTRADHLLTLTYRGNVTDFERTCEDLSKFVRIVKGRKPDWTYIAVAERQRRGAWHWHLAVRGRQDVGLLRASWRRVVGDGNIDVAAARTSRYAAPLALVRYLGKYLAKSFAEDRELNARRFRASLRIQVPTTSLALPPECRGNAVAFAIQELYRATGSVGFVWESDDKSAGWACSWK